MRCFGSWRDQCVCGLKIPYGWVTRIHVSGGGGSVGKLFPLTPPPPCCSVYLEARSPARPGSDKGGGGGRISMLTLCGITVMSAWTNKPAHGALCVCTSVLMFVCVLKNTTCVRFMLKKKVFLLPPHVKVSAGKSSTKSCSCWQVSTSIWKLPQVCVNVCVLVFVSC